MPAQPNEPASESIRNALQVLNAEEPYESRGQRWVEYAAEDVEAIRARLEAALAKLEAQGVLAAPSLDERMATSAYQLAHLLFDIAEEAIGTHEVASRLRARVAAMDEKQRPLPWRIFQAEKAKIARQEWDRKYPDLEERRGAASEPPLDYERPVDPVLRGQEITEDGE